MTSFAEHFGLVNRSRTALVLNTERDAAIYVDYGGVLERIRAALGRAPRFLVQGSWGMGKSHTLRHVERVLLPRLPEAWVPVWAELSGFDRKATFVDAYQRIMVVALQHLEDALRAGPPSRQALELLRHRDSRLAIQALHTELGRPASERLGLLRQWFQGTGPTVARTAQLGLGGRLRETASPAHLAELLRAVSAIHRASLGRPLFLLLDEGAALGTLDLTQINGIQEMLRELVDPTNTELGVGLAIYQRGRSPRLREDVYSRLRDSTIELQPLRTPAEIGAFYLSYWSLVSDGRPLLRSDALEILRDRGVALGSRPDSPDFLAPRDLLQLLDSIAHRAWEDGVSPPIAADALAHWLPAQVA